MSEKAKAARRAAGWLGRPVVILSSVVVIIIAVLLLPGGSTDEPGGVDIYSGGTRLNLVAYAVPKVGYNEIIPAFRETDAGHDIGFRESYGASGDQSRKVVRRIPTDIVNFSVEPDIKRLVDAGLVDKDWKKAVPDDPSQSSVPFGSVVSFVVDRGNPKNLTTWDDLLADGIEVISPNPASSGSAKWNLLAPYAYWLDQALRLQHDPGAGIIPGSEQDTTGFGYDYPAAHTSALGKVEQLVRHFKVRPSSGREATSTFQQGQGDVLLSYENEAIFLTREGTDRGKGPVEFVNPAVTFRIENPVAVLEDSTNKEAAETFRDYLFTDAAAEIWAKQGFRPAGDLFNKDGETPLIDRAYPGGDAPFKSFDIAYSIGDIARVFGEIATTDPELADEYALLTKDEETGEQVPRKGWSIVDNFLFKTQGQIIALYSKVGS